ncbi:MAG TPA: methylated-DNA--[protein]-cysteine S-methyltransferase [Gemmatimonadaceae bacterium]|nr:methylated-DNA--[protein]-cysteine S-methyltransferase [Gemmatimonadaceae bacterium]
MMTRYDVMPSPVGDLMLAATDTHLIGVRFAPHSEDAVARQGWMRASGGTPADAILTEARAQLDQYFSGERTAFHLPLAPTGTDFQMQVWSSLQAIPFGGTISYGELARRIGDPKAMRAVGAANGRNPIPIIVPCHRVIGADGSLTGYGGGMERKRWLLAHEGASKELELGVSA